MPKVNLFETDSFERRLKNNISLVKGRKSNEFLGKQMHLKLSTARNRLNSPLDLTLRDLYFLCKANSIEISDFVGRTLKIE